MRPPVPIKYFFLAMLASVLATVPAALAQGSDQSDASAPAQATSPEQIAWLAKAKAAYPLWTCVVSGEGLGGKAGGPVDYIYHEEGKPDRLVRLCCRSCVRDFKRSPQRFLAKLAAAEAAKAAHVEQAN